MTFLPIAERELRVAARRRNTFWTRLASAGIGVIVGIWALVMSYFPGFGAQPGQLIFGALSGLAFLFCLLGGIIKTADALSEEKRDGTLGLLFLTDLRGYDVVLGKLAATSLLWFYGLLAVFPVLAASMLLGGVAPGEFWRNLLALVNLLFVSLSIGLAVSAVSRHERRAMAGVALSLFLLFNMPTWLGELHRELAGARDIAPGFLVVSPGHAVTMADDIMYGRQPGQYWLALGCSHLVGWLCLALASLRVVRSWQDRATTARAARWGDWLRRLQLGGPNSRVAFRRRWLPVNPFLWLAMRERWKPALVYGALFLLTGYLALEWLFSDRSQPSFIYGHLMLGAMLAALFKVWVALEACRRFVEDRRSGALELLLCTPLGVGEIIRGQWRALLRQFAGPAVLIVGLSVGLLALRLSYFPTTEFWGEVLPYVAWAVVFLVDLVALAWLGMWFGMTSRHSFAATGKAVLWIQIAPWGIFWFCMPMVMGLGVSSARLGAGTRSLSFLTEPWFLTTLWTTISLAIALFFIQFARRKLRREFRDRVVALPKPRRWKRKPAAVPPPVPPSVPPPLPAATP